MRRNDIFTARRSYASAVLGVVMSVCLSVRLLHASFVTKSNNALRIFWYHTKRQSLSKINNTIHIQNKGNTQTTKGIELKKWIWSIKSLRITSVSVKVAIRTQSFSHVNADCCQIIEYFMSVAYVSGVARNFRQGVRWSVAFLPIPIILCLFT